MSDERLNRLLELDSRHVWHPFTQMQAWSSDDPLIIERAEGNYLFDVKGDMYFDGTSSLWVTVHGHRKKEIDDAVRSQLEKVAHTTLLGLSSVPSIELAEKLVQIAPEGLNKVFYSDSGSTSVEIALKMAWQYWRQRRRPEKTRFVALAEAYHGDTIGSVSVGGMDLFHGIFRGMLFPVERLPTPDPYRHQGDGDCLEEALSVARRLFEKKGREIAALIIEPLVQGAAGMMMHPPGYLKGLESLCREFDVLLICDEVATGFGRTGTMFAVEQEDVRPDLMCVAKGITGGYLPLAATLATDEVYSGFLGEIADLRTFFHGHTYTGNPLACAAAIANIDLFEKERLLERVRETAAVFSKALEQLSGLRHVGDVRRKGLMAGVELVADKATKNGFAYAERTGFRVCQATRKRGLWLRPLGDVVVAMPPLSTTPDEARWIASTLRDAIVEVTEE